ncbi:MAG: hypothetical protein IPL59_26785 [Candidatus Competibacteraceae bacterium]|nr:hypothetical protein [Candidatus Competibacteraceae bacterium]
MLARLTRLDYRREMAFIVFTPDSLPGKARIWGVCAFAMPIRIWRKPSTRSGGSKRDRSGAGADVDALCCGYAKSRGIKELYGGVFREHVDRCGIGRARSLPRQRHSDDPGVLHYPCCWTSETVIDSASRAVARQHTAQWC